MRLTYDPFLRRTARRQAVSRSTRSIWESVPRTFLSARGSSQPPRRPGHKYTSVYRIILHGWQLKAKSRFNFTIR